MGSEICQKWHRNPTINPRTGRRITINGPTYHRLLIECGPPPPAILQQVSIVPPKIISPITHLPKREPVLPAVPSPPSEIVTIPSHQVLPRLPLLLPRPISSPKIVTIPSLPKLPLPEPIKKPILPEKKQISLQTLTAFKIVEGEIPIPPELVDSPIMTQLIKQIKEVLSKSTLNNQLREAVKRGMRELVEILIQRIIISGIQLDFNRPMISAARWGYRDIFERIVDLLNQRGEKPDFDNAILNAAEWGHLEIVNLIIDLGAKDLDMRNLDEAMSLAAGKGHLNVVKRLTTAGATDFNNAMVEAGFGGHKDIVELMINLGATYFDEAMDWEDHRELAEWILQHPLNPRNR